MTKLSPAGGTTRSSSHGQSDDLRWVGWIFFASAMLILLGFIHLVFIAAFPLWAAEVITVDVIVIYAIAVHGDEVRN